MVVGHSVGGQIFGLLDEAPRVRRVLMVAAQHNYWGLWRPQERYVLWALWTLLMPASAHALGYFPGGWFGLGEDLLLACDDILQGCLRILDGCARGRPNQHETTKQ